MEKLKRQYRSPKRAAQAEETRAAVLDAADRLFRSRGWSGTTISAIAKEAAVSSETIYAVFANKRTIISRLIADAVRRSAPDVALIDQAGVRAILGTPDPAEQIRLFSGDIADVLGRVAPLMAVISNGAEQDPELSALHAALHAGRRANLGQFVASLQRHGGLRDGLDMNAATAIVWRLASPEMYRLITHVEGLDGAAYAEWLAMTLGRLLLNEEMSSGLAAMSPG